MNLMRRIVSRIIAALSGGMAALRWRRRGRRAMHSYTIVRANRPTKVTPADHDDLLALRKELEYLRCCAQGDSAQALTLLCKSNAFEDRETADYLRDTLMEARAPQTIAAIKAIDQRHPRLRDEIDTGEVAAQARSFHRKVARQLAAAQVEFAESVTARYVKSTGLDASTVDDTDDEPMSETKPNEKQNDLNPTTDADADAILADVEADRETTDTGASEAEAEVDAALAETDLDAIDSLTEDEMAEPLADETESADAVESVHFGDANQTKKGNAVDNALESVEDGIDALNDIVAETQSAADDTIPQDPPRNVAETADDDVEDLAAAVLNEMPASETDVDVEPSPSADVKADVEPVDQVAGAAAPSAPRAHSTPPPVDAGHPPVADRGSSGGHRSRPDRVTDAISDMGAFLLDEVAGLWRDARESIEHINRVRDQIDELHRGIQAVHRDLQVRRDEVVNASDESRRLRDQIQNIREDASRARKRADESANDAQIAADRAAYASREAESLARRAVGG